MLCFTLVCDCSTSSQGLSGLTHLYLQNNRLTLLSGLTVVPRLQKLYCEGNCIRVSFPVARCLKKQGGKMTHSSNVTHQSHRQQRGQ